MSPQLARVSGYLAALLAFSLTFPIVVVPWLALVNRRRTRRPRGLLREDGIEVCIPCGQYLGACDATVRTCPHCSRAREPL